MKFAGKIMFGEIKNDNIRPNAAAVTMSVVVCVWNHDVGLVDFRYMLTVKSCLAFWQKCIKWRQSESLSEMSLFGFGGKIWSQLRLQGCRFSVIFRFFRYFWPSRSPISSFSFWTFCLFLCSFSVRRHAHVDFQLFSQKSSGIPEVETGVTCTHTVCTCQDVDCGKLAGNALRREPTDLAFWQCV